MKDVVLHKLVVVYSKFQCLQESRHCRWSVLSVQELVSEAWDVWLRITDLGSGKFR